MSQQTSARVTQMLADVQRGERDAAQRLFTLVYAELRALAGNFFAARRPGQTLQPTMLVDDVFMKLMQKTDMSWESRAHFFSVAAKAMRDLLVDHARARRAQKRGGDWQRVTLAGVEAGDDGIADVLDLDQALARLAAADERQARIVEMRFFAGLTVREIAGVLDLSERTVMYEWRMARAWLRGQLEGDDTDGR